MKILTKGWLSRPGVVNVAHVVGRCRVLGPGERFCVWAQGCPLRCRGCHNPDFQPFRSATWLDVGDLADRIAGVHRIEGVTFLGGEPFVQAGALAELARRVRTAGLSVMVYSGFDLEQLRGGDVPGAAELLEQTDLLVDGPYRCDLPARKPWRGSDNQRLIALSDRYADRVEQWNRPTGQDFELRVRPDGGLEVLGIPPAELAAPAGWIRGDTETRGRTGGT